MTPRHRWIAAPILAAVALAACRPTPAPETTAPATEPAPEASAIAESAVPVAPAAPTAKSFQQLTPEQVLEPMTPSSLCNLEFLGEELFVGQDLSTKGSEASFAGWVGDEKTRGLPTNPSLRVEADGDKTRVWEAPLTLGLKRDDVAQTLNEPGVAEGGFRETFSLSGLAPGRYHLFLSYQSSGTRYACDSGRFVVLEG
ncbi:hypothetical protein [Pseudoxanthomonas mexicana]